MPVQLDLSNISLEDLVDIHNQVLQRVAVQTKANLGGLQAAGHDSHSSNHSNNKITDRLQQQLSQIARPQG
jgi:hypothetical protein